MSMTNLQREMKDRIDRASRGLLLEPGNKERYQAAAEGLTLLQVEDLYDRMIKESVRLARLPTRPTDEEIHRHCDTCNVLGTWQAMLGTKLPFVVVDPTVQRLAAAVLARDALNGAILGVVIATPK